MLTLRGGNSAVLASPTIMKNEAADAAPAAVELKVLASALPPSAGDSHIALPSAAFAALKLTPGDKVRVRKMKKAAFWSTTADQTVGLATEDSSLGASELRVQTARATRRRAPRSTLLKASATATLTIEPWRERLATISSLFVGGPLCSCAARWVERVVMSPQAPRAARRGAHAPSAGPARRAQISRETRAAARARPDAARRALGVCIDASGVRRGSRARRAATNLADQAAEHGTRSAAVLWQSGRIART